MARSEEHSLGVVLALPLLLAMPALVAWPLVQRWGAEWLVLPVGLGAISFVSYAFDKRQARCKGARLPEAWLLLGDMLGGWPGGFVAQQLLRHKNAKASYQFAFWIIVAVHQAAAGWWLFR